MTSAFEQKKQVLVKAGTFTDLVDLARHRARTERDSVGYVYLQDGEVPSDQLSYKDLDVCARAIGATLQKQCAVGDRLLLLYPPGLEFMSAFFGCLYAGCIGIPAYPPRQNRHDERLEGIVLDAVPTRVLTTTAIQETCGQGTDVNEVLLSVPWIATDSISSSEADIWQEYTPDPASIAFIQYTSGSTSQPKGVCVSHFNLLHNLEDMHLGCAHDEDSVMVTWLPMHHDLGLIYGALQPIYRGFACYMMPPASFLQRPLRWLEAISRFGGTHSAAPNFAFDLCVRAAADEDISGLDLSSMRMVLNAAEPIRSESLQRFFARFTPVGFNPTALSGGYGLAEATLKVCMVPAAQDTPAWGFDSEALEHNLVVRSDSTHDSRSIVGCGRTESDTEYIIVDPQTCLQCAPDAVGEIWVRGPTIALGYLNKPEVTEQIFNARLADCGRGPYLRTGDLGFIYDDNLFVTGRIKDMIIIRGMNHYPHDIELTVEKACPQLRKGCGAAFSIDLDGQEQLVVAYELDRRYLRKANTREIMVKMKEAVALEHGISVHTVSLLRTNTIPKTTSGKIRRQASRLLFLQKKLNVVAMLGDGERTRAASGDTQPQQTEKKVQDSHQLRAKLLDAAAFHLHMKAGDIDPEEPLAHYGLDSAAAVAITGEIERFTGRSCNPTILYECATIAALEGHLLGRDIHSPVKTSVKSGDHVATSDDTDSAIAIVGMGCRFPGAQSPDEFWKLLANGTIATGEIPSERWNVDEYYAREDAPGMMNTRWGGFLEKIDQFDADFFGIAPREADYIDPQHRLLLEVSWEALENGGICPSTLRGSDSGVFIGISGNDYLQLQTDDIRSISAYTGTGGAHALAANRLSYFLDLHGPSLAVDTACSSSLVAVQQAVMSLRNGECSVALAGGVNAILTPHLTVGLSKAQMMSSDGSCKVFDAEANGYVRGEGCGVVVLKRLKDACADGDHVLAVIKGIAVRQDGRSNGITAPNRLAQEAVIRSALRDANLAPAAVTMVEAHGTGTSLGDPIEVAAIRNVYQERTADNICRIGSVKANIGHLESAAGIAGLIKTVLCMRNGRIPGNNRLQMLNPLIELDGVPVTISADSSPWPDNGGGQTAAVSSFGFGGTIAHTIVSAFQGADDPPTDTRSHDICTISACTAAALKTAAHRLASHIRATPELRLQDLCCTMNRGREHFAHKLAIVAESTSALQRKLGAFDYNSTLVRAKNPGPVVFLFSGQGALLAGTAKELLCSEPVFRACIEECDVFLERELNISVSALLEKVPDSNEPALPTRIQPILFALQYGLARLWQSWGITPAAVAGHSLGEYAAACIAGVMSVEDALQLVILRARLAEALPEWGAMAAVFADPTTVEQFIAGSGCEIAAINGPDHFIISGAKAAILALMPKFAECEVRSLPLNVTHGFHSPCVEPMLDAFEEYAGTVTLKEPAIPMFSTLTGKRVGKDIANAGYWRQHVREPVQFQKAVCAVFADAAFEHPETVMLEIGPSPMLISMARRFAGSTGTVWIPSLRPSMNGVQSMLEGLAQLYSRDHAIDWERFYSGRNCKRIALPTYPFQRRRHWLENSRRPHPARGAVEHPLLGNRLYLARDDGRIVWENTLGIEDIPYLSDHMVNGVVVYPGAAFTEMIASAARSYGFRESLDISNIEFMSPLIFSGSRRYCLQTIITVQSDVLECSIYSIEDEARKAGNWRHHVQCTVTAAEYSGNVVEIADFEGSCSAHIDGETFYSRWEARGNHWGPVFRSIQRIHTGEAQCVAWLEETSEVARNAEQYVVHPALLDACVQSMVGGIGGAGAFVGKGVKRLNIAGPLKGKMTARTRWTESDARLLVGDVTVTDEAGRNVLLVEGLTFTFLERDTVHPRQEWFYTEEWENFEIPPLLQGDKNSGTWLIVGPPCDEVKMCAARLRDMGHSVYQLAADESLAADDYVYPVQGIVFFAAEEPDLASPEKMIQAIADMVAEVSQVMAAISTHPALKSCRIWCVTRNVWSGGMGAVPQPASSLWGLYAAIAAEYPENRGGLIDIEAGTDPSRSARFISEAITGLQRCDKLRIGQAVTTPRLCPLSASAERNEQPIRSDSAYLITGGCGRLGHAITAWLCQKGARHIVLIGRSGQLEERHPVGDTRITTAALDISDDSALKAWAEAYERAGNPPIRGIFHAAGVVAKEPVAEISTETCMAAVRAKAGGIMALEKVFDLRSMDFVVLFSSAATLIHSPFLGSYGAANAFLDSYACQKTLQGYPVISIDWSIFADGGMAAVAEESGEARFSKALQPLHSDDGMQIMGELLGHAAGRVAVLPVAWEQWRVAYPSQSELTYWEHVMKGMPGTPEKREGILPDRDVLLSLNNTEKQSVLVQGLTHLAVRALGADFDAIDTARPLTSLGIDSLMALEIRAALEKSYGVALPVVEIISGPSIDMLAHSLVGLLESQIQQGDAVAVVDAGELNETGAFPLSFNQYSQWLLSAMAPDVCAYHVCFSARVISHLNVEVLKRCLQVLVQRHATLRTTYTAVDGDMYQQIHTAGEIPLILTDATGWTDDELYEGGRRAYAQPFDLAAGPPLRAHLLRRDPFDHLLLLVVHHIACDGWSLWLLLEELRALYGVNGELAGAHLDEIRTSYLGYTRRQLKKWTQAEMLAAGRDFWARRLAGMPFMLDLPTDFPRPVTQTLNGASIQFSVSSELTQKLTRMARERNTTMFTLLMAAYQVLLHRITSQPKILVGSPTAGRTDADVSRTVGHFVNMTVICGDLTDNPLWDEFVDALRQEIIASFEHQDFPFHLLVEHLQPERLPGRTPIFQVDFTYQRAHTNGEMIDFMGGTGADTRLYWGGLELQPFVVPQQEGQFDLSLEMAEGTASLFGFMKYNSDLFRPETITHLCRSFCMILESVCETPGLRIGEIPLVGADQRSQIKKWSTSVSRPVPDCLLHQLFAEQVVSIPDERAVVCGKQHLTYRQLDERSERVAYRLQELGVGPDSIVGVLLDRSTDLIVALLAVLKAGGAYLPLDLSHPPSRRQAMLGDSGAIALISSGEIDGIQEQGVTVVDMQRVPEMDGGPLQATVEPGNLAYVIYTSGSTGTPKGVMIEHRSVVNLLTGLQDAIYSGYEGRQQVSLFASTVFDASVQQIFAALCGGHTLHVLTEETRRDSAQLLTYWQEYGVTIGDGTPTLLAMLLDAGLAEREGLSLKHLIIGGEPLSRELVFRLRSGPGSRIAITNIYGPTECCVDVTAMDLDLTNLPDIPVMPVGRPMVNTEVYILDRNRAPVVPGMPGELYIGGPNVGRGYLNRGLLTASSFIESPFEPGARLYKTGDLVRFRPDGTIGFLGRMDNQIKVRGYRIEPGEIEHCLRRCATVRDAVVMAREDTPGDRRLVAYLVMDGDAVGTEAIRNQLHADLPDYMIPSIFVVLPALPVSSSGKVDRGTLPPPVSEAVLSHTISAVPSTAFEREVAVIWKNVIGLSEVGIHDNFFDLGGNSLLLTKVHIRLQETIGRHIAITDLFRFPTIHSLAQFYARDGRDSADTSEDDTGRRQQQKGRAARLGNVRRSLRTRVTETEG
jgi:amino acid adenylation domain-containing protein